MRASLVLLLLGASLWAQELSLRGPVPPVVRLGERAVITLDLDAAGESPVLGALPVIPGLAMTAGAAGRSLVQAVASGAVVDRERVSWSVWLEPRREGVFEIPPLSVETAAGTLRSEPLRLEVVRDVTGGAYAFIETTLDREVCYVGQPFRVRLRVGFDERFFETHAIQMFRQRLDVPLALEAPWLSRLPGAELVPAGAAGPPGSGPLVSFVLDGGRAQALRTADVTVDGRPLAVLELERVFLPLASGPLVIPGALLRFAFATQFEEDFTNGRVPLDRREAFVYGNGVEVEVLPLPEKGRPAGFSGAVGRFSVAARAAPLDLDAGASLQVELTVTGEGNLRSLGPPALGELPGFHVYGVIEGGAPGRTARTFVYDLAPLGPHVRAVPALRFSWFDPEAPAGYRVAETDPIPIVVRASVGGRVPGARGGPADSGVAGVDDIYGPRSAAAGAGGSIRTRLPPALVAGVLAAPWLIVLVLSFLRRVRARERGDPGRRLARGAAAVFHASLAAPASDPGTALTAYLAARLRCLPGALVGPGLSERLVAAGVPADLARRTARLVEQLVAAGYGGTGVAGATQAAAGLVRELEPVFQRAEGLR